MKTIMMPDHSLTYPNRWTPPSWTVKAVERLFRVRERSARQIMEGLEGLRVGNAIAATRRVEEPKRLICGTIRILDHDSINRLNA